MPLLQYKVLVEPVLVPTPTDWRGSHPDAAPAARLLPSLGWFAAPVLVPTPTDWRGFRPDSIPRAKVPSLGWMAEPIVVPVVFAPMEFQGVAVAKSRQSIAGGSVVEPVFPPAPNLAVPIPVMMAGRQYFE